MDRMNAPAKIRKDRRGAPPGDPNKPHKKRREGTPHEGKVGNIAHEPTPENRAVVETHAAVGTPHETIAHLLGISADTLTKYYRAELDHGLWKANAAVGSAYFQLAQGVRRLKDGQTIEQVEPHVQERAARWWMDRRGGPMWRARQDIGLSMGSGEVEAAPEPGGYVPPEITIKFVGPKALPAPEKE